eukprot:m.115558 g.115558  ORF g.115558 m.115558 type:complete len:140 (+) comp16051_c3_seq2:840-1259(+)
MSAATTYNLRFKWDEGDASTQTVRLALTRAGTITDDTTVALERPESSIAMEKVDGCFSVTKSVPRGTWHYMFYVDDKTWRVSSHQPRTTLANGKVVNYVTVPAAQLKSITESLEKAPLLSGSAVPSSKARACHGCCCLC